MAPPNPRQPQQPPQGATTPWAGQPAKTPPGYQPPPPGYHWEPSGRGGYRLAKDGTQSFVPSSGQAPGASHPSPWTPYNVKDSAFDPWSHPQVVRATARAEETRQAGQDQVDYATGAIINRTEATPPTMTGPAPRGNTPTVSMPGRFDASTGLFYDPHNNSMVDARGKQGDVYDAYGRIAAGQGPSVAQDMVRANAQTAATATENAVVDANERYGANSREAASAYDRAVGRAAFDYASASADQRYAFEQAAKNASDATKQAAENAIRAGAALTSQARGGQIGAVLLGAQTNAAQTMAQANQQAAQMDEAARMAAGKMASDQQRMSAYNAAEAQRQASANEAAANATVGSNEARAAIAAQAARAQGDIEAGRIRSAEMLAGVEGQAGVAAQMRAGDQGDVSGAISQQGANLSADTLQANIAAGNADRTARMDEAWAQMEQQAKAANLGASVTSQGQAYQALQGVMNTQAGREAMGLAMEGNFAGLAAQMGMNQQSLQAQVYNAAQSLGVAWQTASDGQKMQIVGAVISGIATMGGVALGAALGPGGAIAGGAAANTAANAAQK